MIRSIKGQIDVDYKDFLRFMITTSDQCDHNRNPNEINLYQHNVLMLFILFLYVFSHSRNLWNLISISIYLFKFKFINNIFLLSFKQPAHCV